MNDFKTALLQLHLQTMVSICIHDYAQQGGPSEEDYARIRNLYPTEIGSHGDAIQFREKGQTARMIDMLVDGLAVLAFCPGGVTAFGLHFEATTGEIDR